MSCPESSEWTGAVGENPDPAMLRHLRECDTCRRDWEIARGVRELLYPDEEVPAPLNDRVMAAVRDRMDRFLRAASPLDLAISAALVAFAGYASIAIPGGVWTPNRYSVTFALICAVAGAGYHKWRSNRERARLTERNE